jgi:hypothetical protein
LRDPPISKQPKQNGFEVVTQVAGHLLCKHKALSSNPNPTKKKFVLLLLLLLLLTGLWVSFSFAFILSLMAKFSYYL